MQAPLKLGLYLLELRLYPSAFCLASHRKPTLPRLPTDVGETQKVEGFRLAQTSPPSVHRRPSAELE